MKEYVAFVEEILSPMPTYRPDNGYGYHVAQTLVQVLKQCGDDLSRENVMRQAANLKELELPMLLPGIRVNTRPTNFYPIRQDAARRLQRRELGAVRRALSGLSGASAGGGHFPSSARKSLPRADPK